MKKIQIALLDEEGFMENLVNYLSRKIQSGIETRLFTNFSMLKKHLQKGETHILIADETAEERVREVRSYVLQIMLLSEGTVMREGSEYFVLFKYQPAKELVREILEQIAEDERIAFEKRRMRKDDMEYLGVYAPFGGAGVSEYAFALAKKKAQSKKTLYVNLEEFQGMEEKCIGRKVREKQFYRGMSEVIFYLKQRKEKLALKLETLVWSVQEAECIFAVEDYRDLHSLTVEDVQTFLEVLSVQTPYEAVVFDIGYLGESTLFLMEQCTKLFMPQGAGSVQQCKEKAFERLLIQNDKQAVWEKFEKVINGEKNV